MANSVTPSQVPCLMVYKPLIHGIPFFYHSEAVIKFGQEIIQQMAPFLGYRPIPQGNLSGISTHGAAGTHLYGLVCAAVCQNTNYY